MRQLCVTTSTMSSPLLWAPAWHCNQEACYLPCADVQHILQSQPLHLELLTTVHSRELCNPACRLEGSQGQRHACRRQQGLHKKLRKAKLRRIMGAWAHLLGSRARKQKGLQAAAALYQQHQQVG